MEFSGVLPEDLPDPAVEQRAAIARMPVPIFGFVDQATLEDVPLWSISSGEVGGVLDEMSVSISSTLWRVPENRRDPRNLAELDPSTAAALDAVPPWPRPAWLIEAAERMRYPMLWEAVRTTWRRGAAHPRRSVHEVLAAHLRYLIVNRVQVGAFDMDWDAVAPELERADALTEAEVVVDGTAVAGVRLDAHDDVVGLGVALGDGVVLTCAVERSQSPFVTFAFATRWSP